MSRFAPTKTSQQKRQKTDSAPARPPRRCSILDPQASLLALQDAAGNQAAVGWVRADIASKTLSAGQDRSGICIVAPALRLMQSSRGHAVDGHARSQTESRTGVDLDETYVHSDAEAHLAATILGAHAFSLGNHIYLGPTVGTTLGPSKDAALKHELVHVAQVRMGLDTGIVWSATTVEREAEQLASYSTAPTDALHGASAREVYGLWCEESTHILTLLPN